MRGNVRISVVAIVLLATFLSLSPMLASAWHDAHTLGLTPNFVATNPSDAGVYFAWIRQGSDGHFITRNLFAPGGPSNHTVYLYFWILGVVQHLLNAGIAPFYGAITILCGLAFFSTLWWITSLFLEDIRERITALVITSFSSGLGWLTFLIQPNNFEFKPIDFLQPEAISFSSIRAPLFAFAQVLMLLVFGCLWKAMQTRSWKPLWYGVPCIAFLANSHTYDVFTIVGVWGSFLAIKWISQRKINWQAAGQALLIGLVAAIPTAINYIAFKQSGNLDLRAQAPTHAYRLQQVLTGYGFLIILAGVALDKRKFAKYPDAKLFLCLWFVVPVVLQYVPSTIQRKLIMSSQIPLSILAAVGLIEILQRERIWPKAAAWAMAATLPFTNLLILFQQYQQVDNPTLGDERMLLTSNEEKAMQWLAVNVAQTDIVQAMPHFKPGGDPGDWDAFSSGLDLAIPGYTGLSVDCGHWCETPNFDKKIGDWQDFASTDSDEPFRRQMLNDSHIRYLLLSDRDCPSTPELIFARWKKSPPSYLRLIPEASSSDVEVYEVQPNRS